MREIEQDMLHQIELKRINGSKLMSQFKRALHSVVGGCIYRWRIKTFLGKSPPGSAILSDLEEQMRYEELQMTQVKKEIALSLLLSRNASTNLRTSLLLWKNYSSHLHRKDCVLRSAVQLA
jgi:hypothetical protein